MMIILWAIGLGLSIYSIVETIRIKRESNRTTTQLMKNQKIMSDMNNMVNFYKGSE